MVEFGAVGIDADTGKLLWKSAHKNKYAVHAATPVYADGRVIFSSGYGQGTEMLTIAADAKSVNSAWEQKVLDNHHGSIVLLGGNLYGTNDRGLAERLRRQDDVVDKLYTAVKLYLTQVSREALEEREGRRWTDIVSYTINMEQIGDIIERVLEDKAFGDAGKIEEGDRGHGLSRRSRP